MADERPYFIMEFCPNGSLTDRIKKTIDAGKALDVKEAIVTTARVLNGLSVAHQKGVVHRDIKPDNILLRESNDPAIVDFGIAKVASATVKTQTGMTMGTVNYMSPEQCRGDADIDGRSDIYSTGIMLYELVTGEVPFTGSNPMSILNKHISEKMPSIIAKAQSVRKNDAQFTKIGRDLEVILEKACAKDRANRYANATEFANALFHLTGTGGAAPAAPTRASVKERENEYLSSLRVAYKDGDVSEERRKLLENKILELGLPMSRAEELEDQVRKEQKLGKLERGAGGGISKKTLAIAAAALLVAVGSFFVYKKITGPSGNIVILSNPSGAKVINTFTDKEEGVTPFGVTKTEAGEYKYRLTLADHTDQQVDIVLKDINTPERREITLVNPAEEARKKAEDDKRIADEAAKKAASEPQRPQPAANTGGGGWSAYQGDMNWNTATARCQGMGMHLPTKEEFDAACNAGLRKTWAEEAYIYWSSTLSSDEGEALTLSCYGAGSARFGKAVDVRCIR